MNVKKERETLLNMLKTKSSLKQDVFQNTQHWFAVLKEELEKCIASLSDQVTDRRIRFRYNDQGAAEAQLYLGSDILIFHMHSNVFRLAPTDYATQTSYVQNDPSNAYCGVINIYNFLADSYQYNRPNDTGYLICRIFINKENRFKVEGRGKLDYLYKNFINQKLTADILHEIILNIGIHALDFDLLTPPYEAVSQVSVGELQELSSNTRLKTGKRLGFQFQADTNLDA
ncbi:MAG: hypothetical protein WDZ35_02305 [Crocinitomicaceae bacterium]